MFSIDADNSSGTKLHISYLMCFAVPALLLLAVYARLGIHPFGSKSLLLIDMDSQFADFYQGLRHMFSGRTSPFFSWHMALGNNYFGLLTYYVSSPLSIIPALFPSAALPDGILVMTLVKIGICGFSFGVFAWRVFGVSKTALPGLATAYALMSYNIIYAMMPMWLDTVALLPLMALGVELLLKENRRMPLIGWTALCIVCNYYTAYMAVLFLLLWFMYRLLLTESMTGRFFMRKCIQFAVCLTAAVGLCAFVLLPSYLSLTGGRVVDGSDLFPVLPLSALGGKLLGGAYDGYRYDSAPSIYCGVAAVLLCACFFFRKGASRREKLATGGLAIAVALCFCLPVGNGLFHMFQPPNWFMYRYAFIGPFFLVSLACRSLAMQGMALENREGGSLGWQDRARAAFRDIIPGLAAAIALYVAIGMTSPDAVKSRNLLPAALTLLGLSGLILLMWRYFRSATIRRIAAVAFAIVLCGDMVLNANELIFALDDEARYRPYAAWSDAYSMNEPVIEGILQTDDGFYRIEKDYQRSYNDAIALGHNAISHYSSAYKQKTIDLLRSLGMWQNWFRSSGRGSTIATDALFGVKYRLSQSGTIPGYETYFTINGISANENPFVLPVAALSQLFPPEGGNPFARQNAMLRGFYPPAGNVFVPAPHSIAPRALQEQLAQADYRIETVVAGPLYLYMDTANAQSSITVHVDGIYIGYTTEDYSLNNMFSLGNYPPGATVVVSLSSQGGAIRTGGYLVYQLDAAKMNDIVSEARRNGLVVDAIYANGLSGTIHAPDGGWMYTSIPYDDGWRLTVDGKPLETAIYADALLSACLPAGSHRVTLRFTPPGLRLGAAVSGATLIACLLSWLWLRRRNTKRRENNDW